MSGTSLAADMDQINLFHIEAQELDTALTEFANEANVQVMFAFDPGIGRRWTSGLNGRYTRAQALTALLAGTRLAFVESGKFVEIVSRNAARTVGPTSNIVLRQPSLIHDGQPPDDPPEAVSVEPSTKPGAKLSQPKENHAEEQLQEVVVTGSQIAGVTELASPLLVFSRADFDDSGVSTIQQFMDQQPANFGGGASEATVGDLAGGGGADNTVQGSGFNLRGLGSDSTLVLINGRRLAAGNIDANFVDTSLIPLSAIQRVEIDPDGASAIYGSDAVGGVVNLILRQNFDGAETRLRYGTVSQSGTREVQASQVLGHSWGSGSVLAGYEYYDRTPLFASDRAYASLQPEPFALLPEQVRQSGFVTARDSLTDRVDVFADGLYARRETDFTYTFPTFVSSVGPADTQLYATSFGADASLSDSVMLELTGTYSGSQTEEQDLFNGESVAALNVRSTLESFDAKASGRLCTIRTGSVMFAVGGQLRREALASADLTARSDFTPSRSIAAGFLELQVPLVRPSEGSAVRDPFALSLAGRYEHYSDFGSTFNPNLGLIWRPIGFFKIRGTYGTSFKAPLLSDENPVPTEVAAQTESDPTTGGLTNVLEVFGGNPKLKPEKANIWTAGVDLQGNGASFHATYYNIRFTDVIANIQAEGIDVSNALSAESELGPSVIARNPSVQEVASLAAAP
ncbi:MAG TPA: TonB-dependent receptor, partial [Terriglobales bacterium]|nr:TonB-dependent receptor [Terriglobales bacterium]